MAESKPVHLKTVASYNVSSIIIPLQVGYHCGTSVNNNNNLRV